jgi:hypothetical protein
MELKVDIGFEQLVQAIKQLPEGKIMQLKAELSERTSTKKQSFTSADLQKFLLTGPIMSDKEYQSYKDLRNRFSAWRAK